MFEFLLPQLAEIECPALLIKAKYDWVTADDQVAVVRRGVRQEKIVVFEQSGHFARVEEPARYTQVVIGFMMAKKAKVPSVAPDTERAAKMNEKKK